MQTLFYVVNLIYSDIVQIYYKIIFISESSIKRLEAVGAILMLIISLSLITWSILYKSMSIVIPISLLFFAAMWLFDLFENWISKEYDNKNEK